MREHEFSSPPSETGLDGLSKIALDSVPFDPLRVVIYERYSCDRQGCDVRKFRTLIFAAEDAADAVGMSSLSVEERERIEAAAQNDGDGMIVTNPETGATQRITPRTVRTSKTHSGPCAGE